MRIRSKYVTPDVLKNLDLLVNQSTSQEQYKEAFYSLGKEIGNVISSNYRGNLHSKKITLACASEDADWLAKGILDVLINVNVSLAVYWNSRFNINEEISIAPIDKTYMENINGSELLIITKSIINTSCVVKTQLTNLIEKIEPQNILITSPVIVAGAEERLKNEFPLTISKRFSFIWFALDDEINVKGEVVPGIGGMIYERLGISSIGKKYIPKIVKERRRFQK